MVVCYLIGIRSYGISHILVNPPLHLNTLCRKKPNCVCFKITKLHITRMLAEYWRDSVVTILHPLETFVSTWHMTKLRLSFLHNMRPTRSWSCVKESHQSKENSYVTKKQGKNTKSRKIWSSTNLIFCVRL